MALGLGRGREPVCLIVLGLVLEFFIFRIWIRAKLALTTWVIKHLE